MSKLTHPIKSASAAASAITATGTSPSVDLTKAGEVLAILNVLAVSGTSPSMTARVPSSPASSGPWTDVPGATFAAVTAAPARQVIGIAMPTTTGGWLRAAWTVTGTSPSFTTALDLVGLRLADTYQVEDAI